jgi:hypothetical protein
MSVKKIDNDVAVENITVNFPSREECARLAGRVLAEGDTGAVINLQSDDDGTSFEYGGSFEAVMINIAYLIAGVATDHNIAPEKLAETEVFLTAAVKKHLASRAYSRRTRGNRHDENHGGELPTA